jgi:hypothetical protein
VVCTGQECARAYRRFPGQFFLGERAGRQRVESAFRAGVAQLVEHLICNQRVGGSNPFASSRSTGKSGPGRQQVLGRRRTFWGRRACPPRRSHRGACSDKPDVVREGQYALKRLFLGGFGQGSGGRRSVWLGDAQVAEWLMAADCKSAAPCELRRFESSPVHQY